MKFPRKLLFLILGILCLVPSFVCAQRQMEDLNRGLVVIKKSTTQTYLGWRLFGDDTQGIAFNLYRSANGAAPVKLNTTPIVNTTDYTDSPANLSTVAYTYSLRPIVNGVEQPVATSATLAAGAPVQQYLSIPLRTDTGPNGPYDVKFAWVGDLDGDGDYDFVVDRLSTLGAYAQFLEAYTNEGVFLWRMAMGANSVNQYAYEPGSSAISVGDTDNVTVYDMDGDGRAEVLVRTATGVTVTNAAGSVVASVTSSSASNQFLSVINGLTGAELARAPMPNPWAVHGTLTNKAMIAYLDGKRPSVVMYGYNRADSGPFFRVFTAWDYRNGSLTQRWSLAQNPAVMPGAEGHQIRIADVDNDGKDEICDIGHVIDDNGTQLFFNELVHGDRFHIADINPDRPGLETFAIQQLNPTMLATAYYDSATGKPMKKWYAGGLVDVGRGIVLDLTPAHKGYEMYSTQPGIFNAKGERIYTNNVWAPEGLWWDGDLGREFVDGAGSGALSPTVQKFNPGTGVSDRVYSVYTEGVHQAYGGRPAFWGDILGDWREEMVFAANNYAELRIYTTTLPASQRIYALMHNPQYRCQATTKGYVQASYVDYYLGYGMPSTVPPPPMIRADVTWSGGGTWSVGGNSPWKTASGSATTFAQGQSVLFDLSGSNASAVVLNGSLSPASVTFVNPQDFALDGGSGNLSGAMSLSKMGAGKVTLSGSHPFTGPSTVWDGALVIDGSLSASPVTVWGGTWGGGGALGVTGGRLAGSGIVGQPVKLEYRGAITPGAGMGVAGRLSLASDLTLADGSVMAFDLSDDPTGLLKANDRLAIGGGLEASGKVTLVINALNGRLPAGTYTLLTYSGSLSGSPANFSVTLPDGVPYSVTLANGVLNLVIPETRAPASVVWSGGLNGNVWDLAATANWSRNGVPDTFVAGDTVSFTSAGGANSNVTLSANLPVNGLTVDSTSSYTFAGEGAITGNGGLIKMGSGTLTIAATNSYTGPTQILGGTLAVENLNDGGSPSSIGASGSGASNLLINGGTLALAGLQTNTNRSMTLGASGGTLSVPTSNTLQVAGVITGSGALSKAGDGILILAGGNSYTGGTVINGGTLLLATDNANVNGLGSGVITLQNGTLSMTENADVLSAATSTWAIHVPEGGTGRLNADTRCQLAGPLTGGGAFTFYTPFVRTEMDGNWSAFTGTISVVTDADGGDFRIRNPAGYPLAQLNLAAGVYAFYNLSPGSNVTLPVGTLSGAAGAYIAGCNSSSRTVTWQVGGRNENSTFAGSIVNATGPTALTKVGTGVLTLSGASTHTGPTAVNAGCLRIDGSTTGSNLTVSSGATLGGGGSITGNVTVQSGAGLEQGSTPLSITGNLILSGNVVIRPAPSFTLAPGTYTLLNYSGTLSGTPNFTWEPPLGSSLSGTVSTSTAGSLIVTLQAASRVPGPITWTGINSFNWDSATLNWTSGLLQVPFIKGDSVFFTDSGLATSPVSLAANFEPAEVVVNTSKSYTLAGPGQITGSATLLKSGSGTLTIASAHTFTGDTTITEGTVAISQSGSLGTGRVRLAGGTWATGALAPPNSVIVSAESTITGGHSGGNHALGSISGDTILNLNSSSVFDLEGDLSGFAGSLRFGGTGSFRFFNTAFSGSARATFDLGTRSLSARQGAAFDLGALSGLAGSSLTMASNSNSTSCIYTIGGNNTDSTFAGVISNGGTKPVGIVKTGDGTLTLAGANNYTGSTAVNAGTLLVSGAIGASATSVASTGTLGGTGSIGGVVNCQGRISPGAPNGTLTFSSSLVMTSTSSILCDLGSTSDRLQVNGSLTLDGTLQVNASSGFAAGTYTVANYTGTLTNNTLDIGNLPVGYTASINTSTAGQVRLVLTQTLTPFQQWQIANFGSNSSPDAVATADPDGDGTTNETEFRLGLDPMSASSSFKATAIAGSAGFAITWPAAPGLMFQIYRNSSLDGTWTLLDTISGTGSYTDTRPLPGSAFYRIVLLP